MESYNGGKSGSGVYQQIINKIPPHNIYIEPFAGHIGIFRKIRRAPLSILNDKDAQIVQRIREYLTSIRFVKKNEQRFFLCDDFFQGQLFEKPKIPVVILRNNDYSTLIERFSNNADAFIYCDPPYPMFTRKSQQRLYKFEWETTDDHFKFLSMVRDAKCNVMISSYPNHVYNDILKDWNNHTFQAGTRNGAATEIIYMNYEKPKVLHDVTHLGDNRRQRLEIKRKVSRWEKKLNTMPDSHRLAVISNIVNSYKTISQRIINLSDYRVVYTNDFQS